MVDRTRVAPQVRLERTLLAGAVLLAAGGISILRLDPATADAAPSDPVHYHDLRPCAVVAEQVAGRQAPWSLPISGIGSNDADALWVADQVDVWTWDHDGFVPMAALEGSGKLVELLPRDAFSGWIVRAGGAFHVRAGGSKHAVRFPSGWQAEAAELSSSGESLYVLGHLTDGWVPSIIRVTVEGGATFPATGWLPTDAFYQDITVLGEHVILAGRPAGDGLDGQLIVESRCYRPDDLTTCQARYYSFGGTNAQPLRVAHGARLTQSVHAEEMLYWAVGDRMVGQGLRVQSGASRQVMVPANFATTESLAAVVVRETGEVVAATESGRLFVHEKGRFEHVVQPTRWCELNHSMLATAGLAVAEDTYFAAAAEGVVPFRLQPAPAAYLPLLSRDSAGE